ncbi:MAG: HugZ family protein [Verrucomicrobiota bacterium]
MTTQTESTTETTLSPEELEAQKGLHALTREVKTATLGTVDAQGHPEASYSPCVSDAEGCFYVYVSALAKHTANLKRTSKASLMLIEDESVAANLHARRRATWGCEVEAIERDSETFEAGMARFIERFGETSKNLANMEDFTLFRLTPKSGRLVLGFGKAFRLDGWQIDSHMRGRHRPSK